MKSGSAQYENRGVDKKREAQGQRGIEYGVTNGFAPVAHGDAESTRLHDA
jgi:hypothetical protein